MDAPWKTIPLISITATTLIAQIAPRYGIPARYALIFFSLFFAQITILFVWRVLIYPNFFSPISHLPHPTNGSFFNGHFAELSAKKPGGPHQEWNNNIPNDGLIYYRFFLNRERILVTNPKGLAEVLVHKSYDFIKPRQLFESIGQLLGIGILLAEDEEHKMQRKNLMPAFHFRHIKDLYPVFWSKSCEMAKALSQISQPEGTKPVQDLKYAPVVEIGNWMSRVTLDIIGVAGMGYDFNAIQDPTTELISTYRSVFSPSRQAQVLGFISLLLPFWLVRALPFQRNFQVVKAVRTIRRICRQVIDKKKEELEGKDKHVGIDILSVALKSGCFTQENLVDQMMTFLAAGHETTATSMIWAIYLLCQHPDIQTRLREEIRGNLPSINDAENTVTAQVFDRLPFLHAVCNEVFRVHPAVPLTVRESAKDTSILGTFVPKGTRIIMAPQATNMAAPLWGPEPEKFDPDRWMGNGRANTGGADSNYAFLTFLHGPRSCIGQSFAKAEFACLLAALVGRFEFELEDPDRKIEIKGGITAKPKDGLPIRIRLMDGW